MNQLKLSSRVFEVEKSGDLIEFCYQQGWTDGLPVVPPTEEKVMEMIEYTGRDPNEVVGIIPPKRLPATIEKIAINAVMAGCLPAYMLILITAIEAMCESEFNFHGVVASTKGAAPLMIISGSVVKELNFNAKESVFGPGYRANASIGRALRLIIRNVGGAFPGELDRGTLGHPGRYSYCIAEDEDDNPWEPLRVEKGFPADLSTLTVMGAEGPHQINDHFSKSPEGILLNIADAMSISTHFSPYGGMGECVVILCKEHAATIAKYGWSRKDIKQFLFEHARKQIAYLKERNTILSPKEVGDENRYAMLLEDPADIILLVSGGYGGRFSAFIPPWGGKKISRSVTKAIGVCLDCK